MFKRISEACQTFSQLMSTPHEKTYWPNEKQKSRWAMFVDQIQWYLKNHELNHFYYLYGLDLEKSVNADDYFGKRPFNRIRAASNERVRIAGGMTSYICLLQDKLLFGQYMKSLGFKVPKIIAWSDKKSLTWTDTLKRDTLAALLELEDQDLFVKEFLGGCGEGVYPIEIRNGEILIEGQSVGVDGLVSKMQDLCLFQKKIEQHSQMGRINPDSVNTVRLVTALHNGEPVLISGICRIGLQSSKLDNWAAGGVAVGLDIEKGELKKIGLQQAKGSKAITQHPDTGVTFEGFEIPFYQESVEAAIGAHRMFFGVHSVGWDIAITPDGPVFIEANNHWDMPMMQIHDHQLKAKFLATNPKGGR